MFFATMMKEENLIPFLERVLNKQITHLVYLHSQEAIKTEYKSKGVVLDVLCWDDEGNVYDVELQTSNKKNEVLRSRIYHSKMDAKKYPPGTNYKDVKEAYVIFICTFDPIGDGVIRYTYSTRNDEPPHKALGDGRHTVFINIYGQQKKLRKGLVSLVKLFKNNRATDSYTKKLLEEMQRVKEDEEWKDMYAWMMDHDEQMRDEGEIRGVIKLYDDEMHLSPAEIIAKIMARFGLDETSATRYVEETLHLEPA